MRQILVTRYGGFGDMILSMGAFRTIRAHHAEDRIAALTTQRFAGLLEHSGYFDEVLLDDRLKPWQIGGWLALVRLLRGKHVDRVYDLQRNERTAILYRVMGFGRRLEWSGVIPGCSHYVRDNPDDRRHIAERLAEQLSIAGIPETKPADLTWLAGDIGHFDLPPAYALIVPGGAPHRPEKRAPAETFAGLGRHLVGQGVRAGVAGTGRQPRPDRRNCRRLSGHDRSLRPHELWRDRRTGAPRHRRDRQRYRRDAPHGRGRLPLAGAVLGCLRPEPGAPARSARAFGRDRHASNAVHPGTDRRLGGIARGPLGGAAGGDDRAVNVEQLVDDDVAREPPLVIAIALFDEARGKRRVSGDLHNALRQCPFIVDRKHGAILDRKRRR